MNYRQRNRKRRAIIRKHRYQESVEWFRNLERKYPEIRQAILDFKP